MTMTSSAPSSNTPIRHSNFKQRTSLHRKITRMVLGCLFLVGAVTGAAVAFLEALDSRDRLRELETQILEHLTQKGRLLGESHAVALTSLVGDNAFGAVAEVVEGALQDEDVIYGAFVGSSGAVWTVSSPTPLDPEDPQAPIRMVTEALGIDLQHAATPATDAPFVQTQFSVRVHRFATPIVVEGAFSGNLYYGLSEARVTAQVQAARKRARANMLNKVGAISLAALFASAFGFLIALRLSSRITRPLAALTDAARAISAGERDVHVDIRSGDEIEQLGFSFNVMVDEVQNYRDYLEDLVTQRTAALEEAQSDLLESSRLAGMTEVVTGVLHNVGNIVNSMNVSVGVALDKLRSSRLDGLAKVADLMLAQGNGLGRFISEDERGKRLPGYLSKLGQRLQGERNDTVNEVRRIEDCVNSIRQIIVAQRAFTRVSGVKERLAPEALFADVLVMQRAALSNHDIRVERSFSDTPPTMIDKSRVVQILTNLVTNAIHSMAGQDRGGNVLELGACYREKFLRFTVKDSGIGIEEALLARIFSHGFTTRDGAHGFGLHHSANAATEMGGRLWAESSGVGEGATFILEIAIEDDAKRETA